MPCPSRDGPWRAGHGDGCGGMFRPKERVEAGLIREPEIEKNERARGQFSAPSGGGLQRPWTIEKNQRTRRACYNARWRFDDVGSCEYANWRRELSGQS